MIKLETYDVIKWNVSLDLMRNIIVVEGIVLSTKTKAQDYLHESRSFQDRVIKKMLRTKLFDESSANIIYEIYQELIKFDSGDITLDEFYDKIEVYGL